MLVVDRRPEEDVMESVPLLDCAGRRRSPATLSGLQMTLQQRLKADPPEEPVDDRQRAQTLRAQLERRVPVVGRAHGRRYPREVRGLRVPNARLTCGVAGRT
jgi:hypothetical protein